MSDAAPVETDRLRLIPASVELLQFELSDRDRLYAKLGVKPPAEWPPELNDENSISYTLAKIEEYPDQFGWWYWYVILRPSDARRPALVGGVGLKGPPDSNGTVEVGYSILREYRGRGFATEAVDALCQWAVAHGTVKRIIGETLPELVPSIRVLQKLEFIGPVEGSEPGVIRFVREFKPAM